nr:penicillin-binding protein 1C [Ardenticatena sp.]
MREATKLALLHRIQRQRRKRKQPGMKRVAQIGLALLLGLLLMSMIPLAGAAVGAAYLMELTPPFIDRAVEQTVGFGVQMYARYFFDEELPSPDDLARRTQRVFKTTKIYDRTGQHLLWEIIDPEGGNRQVIPLEDIPLHVRQAAIALEDRTFYENPGVNLRGIARALYQNLRYGTVVQGGSSITQQLVKNVLIDPEERYKQSYSRKIKEVILAFEISRRYDKDTILEWYLNTINYGRLAYGIQAAAQTYFGKDAKDLTLAEAAMLAALPNAPALYDPFTAPEQAKKRQEITLQAMYEAGFITREEMEAAKAEPVLDHLAEPKRYEIKAPHFVFYVQKLLEEKYGPDMVYRGGLTVYTTIDLDIQNIAEESAREHVRKLQEDPEKYVTNAAVVVLNPKTGEILSMVGSLDYFDSSIDGQINMAITPRQPGSSFKPFTYVTAFAKGYTPATMLWDVRTVFDDSPNPAYVPENYDRRYHGPVTLRKALANSYNIPAVKLMEMVGIPSVLETAHRMGINTLNREDYGLSLALGSGEVTLLDLTYAYSVFANNGVMAGQPVPPEKLRPGYRELDPVAILRVEDANGNVLEEYTQPETRQVLSPQLAYLITDILSDEVARQPAMGAGSPLLLSRPAAAKTGTTNDFRDNWTIGYTPQFVTGVWVGNTDNSEMGNVSGLDGAAPIWNDVMEKIHEGLPVEEFIPPPGLVAVQVCAESGLLPTPACPRIRTEIFIEGTQPTTYDNLYQIFRICKPSGKLATVYCPPDQIEEKVFMVVPPEAVEWAQQAGIELPPTDYDTTYGPVAGSGTAVITSPQPYGYVGGIAPIQGTARTEPPDQFKLYRIEFGQGLDPASWIQIGPDYTTPVVDGLLEQWDTRALEEGLYTLQLTVLRQDGQVERTSVQVTVDNTPPTVRITYPFEGQEYVLNDDEWVSIQVDASDNIAMREVRFFIDGREFARSSIAPFTEKWTLDNEGRLGPNEIREHEIYVVAVDAAGNETQSERVRIRVRGNPDGN